jgi:hypothetical protein
MVTLKQINRALKNKGYEVELIKGEGYFYFEGRDADNLTSQGVYIPRLSDQSVEEWVKDFEILKKNS